MLVYQRVWCFFGNSYRSNGILANIVDFMSWMWAVFMYVDECELYILYVHACPRFVWSLHHFQIRPQSLTARPWKMMVGRLLSFWDGLLSEAMLNFQGVFPDFDGSQFCSNLVTILSLLPERDPWIRLWRRSLGSFMVCQLFCQCVTSGSLLLRSHHKCSYPKNPDPSLE